MLDDTLLLTVNGLMIVIMTSGAHCHTSIHIQSYNHSYAYKHTHKTMQWCCTQVYETFPWKAVPILGLFACRRCSSADWLSDPWSLRLPPVQFTRLMVRSLVSALRLPPGSSPGWFSKCGCPRLPAESSGLIVGPLQFTRAMVGSGCILALRACHQCN